MKTIQIEGDIHVDEVVAKLEEAIENYIKRRYTYARMHDASNVKFMDECIARTKAAIRRARVDRVKQLRS